MAIMIGEAQRIVRETTSQFEYEDPRGTTKWRTIRVRYYSPTIADLRKLREEVVEKAKTDGDFEYWLSYDLARQIESLPDIEREKDKPYPITQEALEDLSITNLKAIKAAIEEDLDPKKTTATP